MPAIVIEVILFIVGLLCLVKGGDWFVDGATGIAHRFNMPEILIGATVVSIGTTIPEVMVSSTAALTAGASDMAYGNAIGSIICNTALIAAITMTFRPAAVEKNSLKMPIAFFFVATAIYVGVAYATGYFSRPVGIMLLAIFVAYMILCVKQAKESMDGAKNAAAVGAEKGAGAEKDAGAGVNNTVNSGADISITGSVDSAEGSGATRNAVVSEATGIEDDDDDIISITTTPYDPEDSRMTDDYIQNVLEPLKNPKTGEDSNPDDPEKSRTKSEANPGDSDNSNNNDKNVNPDETISEAPDRIGTDNIADKSGTDKTQSDKNDSSEKAKSATKKEILMDIGKLILGAAVIAVGAHLLVDNGTLIAEAAGVPQTVIALTFVALGTSLPELVTAITSLVKGHSDLSLGNVIGANLFNLVLVSGLAITLAPFKVPVDKTIAGMNASLVVDIPVMITVMLIMCLPALIKGRIYRAQGISLLCIYAGYVAFQFT